MKAHTITITITLLAILTPYPLGLLINNPKDDHIVTYIKGTLTILTIILSVLSYTYLYKIIKDLIK